MTNPGRVVLALLAALCIGTGARAAEPLPEELANAMQACVEALDRINAPAGEACRPRPDPAPATLLQPERQGLEDIREALASTLKALGSKDLGELAVATLRKSGATVPKLNSRQLRDLSEGLFQEWFAPRPQPELAARFMTILDRFRYGKKTSRERAADALLDLRSRLVRAKPTIRYLEQRYFAGTLLDLPALERLQKEIRARLTRQHPELGARIANLVFETESPLPDSAFRTEPGSAVPLLSTANGAAGFSSFLDSRLSGFTRETNEFSFNQSAGAPGLENQVRVAPFSLRRGELREALEREYRRKLGLKPGAGE